MSAVLDAFHGLTVHEFAAVPTITENHAAEVFHDQACLYCILSLLDDDISLLRASAVCKQWKAVVDLDSVWQAVYRRMLPQPLEFERVNSYRQQFKRLRGLLEPPTPQATPLKGAAVCYNTCTGSLVSYNARQLMLSVQLADGSVRSLVLRQYGDGTAHKPLLTSTGSELVVLAAFDGPLVMCDVRQCEEVGVLGRHQSFVTSLDASGHLLASTCSFELKLWNVEKQQCLFSVPIGTTVSLPVLEPHVAVCHQQQLLGLANCAAPSPSSVIKVYSTEPAGRGNSNSSGRCNNNSSIRPMPIVAMGPYHERQQQQQQGVHVGSSTLPDATGALLLRELPVNAAADIVLQQGLLLVASCFHGRAVSSNTPYKSERPFTVVVHIWDTTTWQLTRLVSPRLWTDYPTFAMLGMPLITVTQGMLLCATLRSGVTAAPPSCCIHAWQLPQHLLATTAPGEDSSWGLDPAAGGGNNSSLRVLSVSPSKQSSMATAAGAGNSSGGTRPAESYGEGAMALGRAAIAAAGGAGPVGVLAANTVMLAVSDQERDAWMSLLDDTKGQLTAMLTTPDQLVMATESGQVFSSRLLPQTQLPEYQGQNREQDQHHGDQHHDAGGANAGVQFVHVEDAAGGYIDIDLLQ